MTRIVIVGEIYNADLSVGGGPVYPGGGSPAHPTTRPPGYPAHPIQPVPPGFWGGVAPPIPTRACHPARQARQATPGSRQALLQAIWGGMTPHPDQGLPGGSPGAPDQGLPGPQPPPGGTDVPEDVYSPPPVPEEIASQVVVSVYNPKTMEWTTKSYPPR